MYRAVMKQVVSFLERAHKSLEVIGTRMNSHQNYTQRSKSDHYLSATMDNGTLKSIGENTSQYEDAFW